MRHKKIQLEGKKMYSQMKCEFLMTLRRLISHISATLLNLAKKTNAMERNFTLPKTGKSKIKKKIER